MKRKIKDFKDFLECIKEGKKVTDGNSNTSYFLQNGYICSKGEDDYVGYNAYIDSVDLLQMEVEEKEKFKIKADKFYKTRDCRKVYCYEVKKDKCFFAIAGHGSFITDKAGNYNGGNESCFDVVDYWEDK